MATPGSHRGGRWFKPSIASCPSGHACRSRVGPVTLAVPWPGHAPWSAELELCHHRVAGEGPSLSCPGPSVRSAPAGAAGRHGTADTAATLRVGATTPSVRCGADTRPCQRLQGGSDRASCLSGDDSPHLSGAPHDPQDRWRFTRSPDPRRQRLQEVAAGASRGCWAGCGAVDPRWLTAPVARTCAGATSGPGRRPDHLQRHRR